MADVTEQTLSETASAILGGVCNRGVIASGGSVLVVDSGISVAEATPLRELAQQRLGQRGQLALFNTHSHGDHTFGNQVFANCPIMASDDVRQVLTTTGPETLVSWKSNPQMAQMIGDVTITPPTVTFAERLNLYMGDLEVQLIRVGTAHSPGDAVAWLPQEKVLFAGDLLFNALVPAMPPGGNSATWVRALEYLETLGATQVIPGHGPIQTPAALGDLRNWLIALRNKVADAITSGAGRDAAIAQVAPVMQQELPREREERLSLAIGRAFDDLTRERAEERKTLE